MLDSTFVANLRQAVHIHEMNEYLQIARNLKYSIFTKHLPSTTLKERYVTLLENAVIRDYGVNGGSVRFEEQVTGEQSFVNHVYKSGWAESEYKFKDLANGTIGGEGINLLSQWTKQVTARAAYQPQYLAISALRAGTATSLTLDGQVHDIVCYDSQPLFSQTHPYNFKRTSLGYFCNYFKGAPASAVANNIGFKPLAGPFAKNAGTGEWEYDASAKVSVEDAWNNLWDTITAIAGVKMADGLTPRYLKPTRIVAGTKLRKAITTLLSAQFIAAQASSGTGGATDIKGTITALGLAEPAFLDELVGLGTNEEWDWYLICEENAAASELGVINVGINEPWKVVLYAAESGSAGVNLELAIADEVRAVGKMRAFVGVGLPQFAFKQEAPRS